MAHYTIGIAKILTNTPRRAGLGEWRYGPQG